MYGDVGMAKDKSSKNTVKDIEERLTYLSEYYIESPEIYELLKQLAKIYIFQNRYIYGYSDVEAVCHDVAADTWMRMRKGNTHITHWIYYIGRSIKLSYVKNQRRIEHEVVDTTGNPGLRDCVISMCAGSSKSFSEDFNSINKLTFLQNIDMLIRQVLSHTKFKQNSKDWLTLYTNVCMSLYNGKITYFRISEDLKPYVRLVLNQFRFEFVNSDFMQRGDTDCDEDLPTLLFYDEQLLKDKSSRKDV